MSTVPGHTAPGAARRARTVRSQPVDLVGSLVARLPHAADALAWLRDGRGIVGWGEAARLEVSGPDRFVRARDWWQALVARAEVDDEVRARGSGPVAFGSFAFSDDEPSLLVVPEVVLGRDGERTWLTTVGEPLRLASPEPVRATRGLRYAHGDVPVTDFRAAVARAVDLISSGVLAKVVLARDLVAVAEDDIDVRAVLAGLTEANPDCWTYAVGGLVGATPELLLSRAGDRVLSRVLAGTTGRGVDADEDRSRVDALLHSVKNQEEHRYAVESVVDALAPHVHDLAVPDRPHALVLSNLTHLATDVTATVRDGSDVLDLLGSLHPSAAVGGTPRRAALGVIGRLEAMERGRYAGPVGWVDANGDGEWGIALRCAQLAGPTARLFAGCGIVADSDPDEEVAETQAKLVPVRDALEGASS
ncbi:MAG: menaquinone-specific isochorismate synthase [Actinomycetota bacterium]|jgi:menaquinone-specific isochorismate synthase|nr:menaquinone-specific isochorismate synthase [Actinomycetota bacterium]